MQFQESTEGDYRIFAGAIEAPTARGGGYLAALVVNRTDARQRSAGEAFRDTALAAGYAWESADEALRYAIARGQEIVRRRPTLLAC